MITNSPTASPLGLVKHPPTPLPTILSLTPTTSPTNEFINEIEVDIDVIKNQ